MLDRLNYFVLHVLHYQISRSQDSHIWRVVERNQHNFKRYSKWVMRHLVACTSNFIVKELLLLIFIKSYSLDIRLFFINEWDRIEALTRFKLRETVGIWMYAQCVKLFYLHNIHYCEENTSRYHINGLLLKCSIDTTPAFIRSLFYTLFYTHREGIQWAKVEYTPGWVAGSSQSPIWAFVGSVPCWRVPGQCSKGVLAPSFTQKYNFWKWQI